MGNTALRSFPAAFAAQRRQATQVALIVEEDRERRRTVLEWLEQNGHAVLATSNATDALLICQRFRGTIDLVLAGKDKFGSEPADWLPKVLQEHPSAQVSVLDPYFRQATGSTLLSA